MVECDLFLFETPERHWEWQLRLWLRPFCEAPKVRNGKPLSTERRARGDAARWAKRLSFTIVETHVYRHGGNVP